MFDETDNETVVETEYIRQSTLLNAKVNTELNQDQFYTTTVLPVPSSKIVTRNVDRSDCIPEGNVIIYK